MDDDVLDSVENKSFPNERLLDRLAKAGIVYSWPIDSPQDKKEMGICLTYTKALFYYEAIPGEGLVLCLVKMTRVHGERLVLYQRSVVTREMTLEVGKMRFVLSGSRAAVLKYFGVAAMPYIRRDAMVNVTSWVALQRSKPSVMFPCFRRFFKMPSSTPTIFGYPGDQHTLPVFRMWASASMPQNLSGDFSVVFGNIGVKTSLNVYPIMSVEGEIACSAGKRPWEIHSYLYSPCKTSGRQRFEWQVVPVYKVVGSVIVFCFQNATYKDGSLEIDIGIDSPKGVEHHKMNLQVPKRSLRMFAAIEVTRKGVYEFKNKTRGSVVSLP